MNEKAHSTFIEEPTKCPCCEHELTKIKDQLFCKNSSCSAQVNKKLEHFCKTLGIKGVGPKTAEKLQLQDISEIYYVDWEEAAKELGNKIAEKLQEEVEKSKNADLETVLAALSIPLIGNTAAQKICSVITHISEINQEKCRDAGLGEKATNNLLEWLEDEGSYTLQYLPFTFKTKPKQTEYVTTKTVCITGKLKSFKKKADAEELLAKAGYKLVDSVTKSTNILVDESDGRSSKRELAEKYGITIITDLNDLLKETN